MRKAFAAFAFFAAFASAGCGKKGPPLPPLVRLPSAPAEFAAERRGSSVDLQFVVPAANTDNTRPANVERVDVYAITSPEPLTEELVAKHGTLVASVKVKAPRDPDRTIEEDEPAADMEPPQGDGLDQGAVARVSETLTANALVPVVAAPEGERQPAIDSAGDGPLLPPGAPPTRSYVAVGVSTRGRRGAFTKQLAVPLTPPPAQPAAPDVAYDEKAITVTWDPVAGAGEIQRQPADGELPSIAIGAAPPAITYNVYGVPKEGVPARLNAEALGDPQFSDPRIVWGEERCYTVRAVETIGDLKIESDAPPPVCTTLTDTFAPAAPSNLQSTPTEGAINLIWDANGERDVAGYIVLRGDSPQALKPVTTAPVQETTFRDQVQPGLRYIYAVKAVDRTGNESGASKTVEEAARE